MPSMRDLLAAAKSRITEVDVDEAERRLAANPAAVVLDVREPLFAATCAAAVSSGATISEMRRPGVIDLERLAAR